MNEHELQQLGFTDAAEFFYLTANADLSSMEKIAAFKRWQNEDGTKAGILKISQGGDSPKTIGDV